MHITIEHWPETLDNFQALKIFDLRDPHHTTALFLLALDLFTKDQDLGVQAINLLKGPVVLNPHNISFLKDRLMDKPYLPKAYFDGATPENDYEPDLPFTLKLFKDQRPDDLEEDYMRVFVKTSGADSKRFVTLRRKDDHWYLWDYPGILMDIRKPKQDNPWL